MKVNLKLNIQIPSHNSLRLFKENANRIFDRRRNGGVGLALSGGVDSMALAWLWHYSKQIRVSNDDTYDFGLWRQNFKGLIVDHKLRPESTREAHETAERFLKLTGNDALIIDLDWNAAGGVPMPEGMESAARRLRYRALGKACRDHDLDYLLTGHHADDNAETVLLRLIGGARDLGLSGIASMADIPECDGLEGVVGRLEGVRYSPFRRLEHSRKSTDSVSHYGCMGQGIQVVRPLLPFKKLDLIKICEEQGIQWVEDESNENRNLTLRNTIRHLLHSKKLPTALQAQSLLRIAEAKHVRQKDRMDDTSLSLRERIQTYADVRSGVISVKLADRNSEESSMLASNNSHNRNIGLRLVREIVSAASGSHELPLKDCQKIYEALREQDFMLAQLFRGKDSAIFKTGDPRHYVPLDVMAGGVSATAHLQKDTDHQPNVVWRFARQKPPKAQQDSLTLPLQHWNSNLVTSDYPYMTEWDGRFWIRAKLKVTSLDAGSHSRLNGHATKQVSHMLSGADIHSQRGKHVDSQDGSFNVRLLRREDLIELRRMTEAGESTLIKYSATRALLSYKSLLKCGNKIPVLPIIARSSLVDDLYGVGTIVAFPSVDYVHPNYAPYMEIELAYKSLGRAGISDGRSAVDVI